MDGEAAYRDALRGDFRATRQLLPKLREAGRAERAWAFALSAQLWHAAPDLGHRPAAEDLAGFAGTDGARAAALACAEAERAAFLSFDAPRLEELLALHTRLAAPDDVLVRFGTLLHRTLAGEGRHCCSEAEALESDASARGVAELVVQAAALRAHAALEAGDLEEATRNARRAARMARTEELPQPQYFANVVLARLRRFSGRPHLSVRILSALARVVPPQWATWVGWELLLAGGPDELEAASWASDAVSASLAPLAPASAMLSAARAGDRVGFDAALDRARRTLAAPTLHHDLDALAALSDPDRLLDGAGDDLERWAGGEGRLPPHGLIGAGVDWESAEGSVALVAARPDRPARRILAIGGGLCEPVRSTARPGRIETLVAVLALAGGERIHRDVLFREVYNFEYDAALHKGPFEVLVHRARALIGDAAVIERSDPHLSLDVRAPFVVPDPRCQKPLGNKLLQVLARGGTGSARDAAEAAKVPLRTAQLALKRLIDEGACEVERRGRHVVYQVEDTTFHEPTRH